MKKFIVIYLIFVLFSVLSATPEWFIGSSESKDQLIGNGCAKIIGKDVNTARQQAIEDALSDISRRLLLDISSQTFSIEEETTQGKKPQNTQTYVKDIQIKSSISMTNYAIIRQETKRDMQYVQVGIDRDVLTKMYRHNVENQIKTSGEKYRQAQKHFDSSPNQALSILKELHQIIRDLEKNILILGALTQFNLPRYEYPSLCEVESNILELNTNQRQDMTEIARDIIKQIPVTIAANTPLIIYPYEWQNTGFSSEFGETLSVILKAELTKKFQINTNPKSLSQNAIFGQVIPCGNCVYLQTNLIIDKQEHLIFTYLNKATCEYIGMGKIKPTDLERRLAERDIFLSQATQDSRLKAELATGEFGRNPAVYHLNDKPSILVRVNQACYITLFYIEADGTKNILLQNHFLNSEQANQWIRMPLDLIVCEPFGVEQLFIQADVVKLPLIQTKRVNLDRGAFKDIVQQDLEKTLALTRGIKQVEKQSQLTEDYLNWTILK